MEGVLWRDPVVIDLRAEEQAYQQAKQQPAQFLVASVGVFRR
jgi:hypothetical protein